MVRRGLGLRHVSDTGLLDGRTDGRTDRHTQQCIVQQCPVVRLGLGLRHVGSRALSFSDPYFHFMCLSVCHSVVLSATSKLNISETRPDSGMVPMDSLYKLAYGLSMGRGPDDVT